MSGSGEVDASIPETSTEELLACIHILYVMFDGDYKAIDKWIFTSNENLSGEVPIDSFTQGEGLVILEYLRDVFERRREKVMGGLN